MKRRKVLYGVGVNDSPEAVRIIRNGKRVMCPYYQRWTNMLQRCYCRVYQKRNKAYKQHTVHPDWHKFSAFKSWMEQQDWEGMHLDKDALDPHNTVYSPSTCIFIPSEINMLLTYKGSRKGKYPVGVSRVGTKDKYRAAISIGGQSIGLGTFGTPETAYEAYRDRKVEEIRRIATTISNTRLQRGLEKHCQFLLENHYEPN